MLLNIFYFFIGGKIMAVDFRNLGKKSDVDGIVVGSSNDYSATTENSAGLKVLRNAYLLLSMSMIPAFIGAVLGYKFFPIGLLASNPIISFVVFIGAFYGMIFAVEKNNTSSLGVIFLQGFTFMLGFMTGPLLMMAGSLSNGWQLVALAFGGATAIFFTMAAIATSVKKPLTGLTNFLLVGGIVLMVGVVASVFLQIPALHLAITCGFLLFSTVAMLWRMNMAYHNGNENYISLTLGLVVDLYNIFTSLLRLLLVFAGNRD